MRPKDPGGPFRTANDTPPLCPKCGRGPMASMFGLQGQYDVCIEEDCNYAPPPSGKCFPFGHEVPKP